MNIMSNPKTIIRLTETEFETDDGAIYPIPFEMETVPTIAEFQKIYDDRSGE